MTFNGTKKESIGMWIMRKQGEKINGQVPIILALEGFVHSFTLTFQTIFPLGTCKVLSENRTDFRQTEKWEKTNFNKYNNGIFPQ